MEAQEARAIQKYIRRSPRKVRLVADSVRGLNVDVAIGNLMYTKKASAVEVMKVIKSAAANFRDRFQEDQVENDGLYVKTIYVDGGATLKRIQPAPMGRAYQIRKRTCHITVVVARIPEDNN